MQVRLVRTLVAIALAGALGQGCGPSVSTPVVPPTPMQRDPRCAGFELDVAHVWNQQTRGEIKTAFGRVGGGYSKQVVARVITKMDNITRDWVMLKENLCTDCLVRGLISKDIYATRSACYDASLIRQRMLIEYLKNADQKTVDHSLAVFGSVLDNLLQCQSEAISTSATASAS